MKIRVIFALFLLFLLEISKTRNEVYGKPSQGSSTGVDFGHSNLKSNISNAPNLCQRPEIDAVTVTQDGNTYFFKGEFYWRILNDGIAKGYPRVIRDNWDGLPGNLDAALTWEDGKTFFFKDSKYWRFLNKRMDIGYPKEIAQGFEGIPNNVDAALVWSGNEKTYFFKGNQYWKFDSDQAIPVSNQYPKAISTWKGIPDNLDAAFQWNNKMTYFFKGVNYYRFNDKVLAVDHDANPGYPRPTAVWWFSCKYTPGSEPVELVPVETSSVTDHPATKLSTENTLSYLTPGIYNKTRLSEITPDYTDEDRSEDYKLPIKGNYDVGMWEEYSTTDYSRVRKEHSKADYRTDNDDNYIFPDTSTSTTVNSNQPTLLSDTFLLLITLNILWY